MTPTRPAEAPVAPALIGTGGFGYSAGSAFPGAAAPQGLAKVGPDTVGPWGNLDFLHCAGYWYEDTTIQGFSHMHVHGTGVPDYGVLGIMPVPSFDGSQTTMAGIPVGLRQVDRSRRARQVHGHPFERRHPRRGDGDAACSAPPLHLRRRRYDSPRRPRPRSPPRQRHRVDRDGRRRSARRTP